MANDFGFDFDHDDGVLEDQIALMTSDKKPQTQIISPEPVGFGFLNDNSFEDFAQKMHQIGNDLARRTQGWERLFEDERRGIGKGYQLQNSLVHISKKGIEAVRRCKTREVRFYLYESKRLWVELGNCPMPGYKSWEFDSESGQEIKEFQVVAFFYIYLVGLPESEQLITLDDLWHEGCNKDCDRIHVSPAVFAHGYGDAMSEIGKMLAPIIVQELSRLAEGEQFIRGTLNLRKRFVAIAEMMYELLKRFETVYEMVVKATLRLGYGNTYRALLGRLSGIICREYERIAETMQQIEYQKWNATSTREAVQDEARKAVRDEMAKYFQELRERQES